MADELEILAEDLLVIIFYKLFSITYSSSLSEDGETEESFTVLYEYSLSQSLSEFVSRREKSQADPSEP